MRQVSASFRRRFGGQPSRHKNAPSDFQYDHNHEENNNRPDHLEGTTSRQPACHFVTIPDVYGFFGVICHANILGAAPGASNANRVPSANALNQINPKVEISRSCKPCSDTTTLPYRKDSPILCGHVRSQASSEWGSSPQSKPAGSRIFHGETRGRSCRGGHRQNGRHRA